MSRLTRTRLEFGCIAVLVAAMTIASVIALLF